MVSSTSCLLLLAAAVASAMTVAHGADLTTFPVDYDVLAVSLEFEVEFLATKAVATKDEKLGVAFNAFADQFDQAVAAGTITLAQQNADQDAFYKTADALVPTFSKDATAAIQEAWTAYEFEFLLALHAAQWDALHYGITQAKPVDGITALFEKVDAFMAENVKAGDQAALQAQLDAFFADAEKITPDLKKTVVGILKDKARPLFGDAQKAVDTPAMTTTETPAPTKAPGATPAPTTSGAGAKTTRAAALTVAATTLLVAVATLLV